VSVYTTTRMTREQVLDLIARELPKLEREQLESIADVILKPALYNCLIVPSGFEDKS
jgi:hypothetical protein